MNILNLIAFVICAYFGFTRLSSGDYGLATLQFALAALNLMFILPR